MKLKQSIGDAEKELKDAVRTIETYQEMHDQLTLEDVEYVVQFLHFTLSTKRT